MPACSLALPRLGAAVPRVVRLSGSEAGAAGIARALLAAGILQESDWCGDASASLESGLQRWVRDLGGDRLKWCGLAVCYTDCVGEDLYGLSGPAWRERMPGAKVPVVAGAPVGWLAVAQGEFGQVCAGARVQELERVWPGAGFAVLYLLTRLFAATFAVATPAWTLWHLEDWGWLEVTEQDDPDALTLDRFYQQIPMQACGQPWNRELKDTDRVLATALKMAQRPKHRSILEQALSLHQALEANQAAGGFRDDTWAFTPEESSDQELAGMVRWSADDPIERVTDDYREMLWQSGCGTDLLYARGFQLADPASVVTAAQEFRRLLEIGVGALLLAQELHLERKPTRIRVPRPRVEVRPRALVEILT